MPVLEVPSPSGDLLLTESEGDLWLRAVVDDRLRRLTNDAGGAVRWSIEGAVWSPDGLSVAAVRTESTGVDRLPIVHWLKPGEEVEFVPYTKTGRPAEARSLNLLSTSGQILRIDPGCDATDLFLLVPLRWTAAGELLFLVSDRTNKVLELRACGPRSGQSRPVVAEHQDSFVYGIRFDAAISSATLTPDGERLIWLSERDGWRHAYLYDLDGQELCQLTSGPFEVERVVGFAKEMLYLLARSDPERPYDLHCCRVALDGSAFTQLTESAGTHMPLVSPSGEVIVDIHSAIDRPPRTDLLGGNGEPVATLSTADTSALDELGYTPPEEFVVTALDGQTPLHGVLYRPPAFDPSRRYPLVEYIYAGPQVIRHPNDYKSPCIARLLAQVGFVTCVVDGPGTPGRGKVFQDQVYRRFGQYEIPEHANVIRQLTERHPFVDGERVGIIGGSWGGYNTVRALLLAPDTYHVGVAIFPVGDCLNHIGAAIEPYLDLPDENPDGYARSSSLPLAEKLVGQLLMVHGTSDVNAPFGSTMELADAFVRADRPFDLLVVPEMDHSMEGFRGRYMMERAADYFLEHLGAPL